MATHAPPEPGAVHALTRWVRPRAAVLLLVATAAAAAPPLEARQQQAGSGDSDAQPGAVAAALDSVVRATLAEQGVPGASVLVRRGGTVLLERGYGLAEVENEVPAGPETAYRIGSVTKQFTAAAVLRLVEQDAIDLDASLERYLPEYDTGGRRVTVRQLLNHTSGIRSYTGLPSWRGVRRLATTHDEMLRVVMDEPFDFEPGT